MTAPARRVWSWAALAAALAAFHAATLKRFPIVDMDEAMEANHSWNILARGRNVYSLYEGLFPRRFAFMEHGLPNVLRPFYNMSLALAFRLGGVNPWSGRALSLLCALGALALLARLVRRWTGRDAPALAFAAMLGVDRIFAFSAHEIRPEALLLLCAAAVFFLLDRVEQSSWYAVPAGLLAALAPGVHTNGGAVALSALAVLLVRRPRAWPHFMLGASLGTCATLSFVRPERFLPSWVVFGGFFSYTPPVRRLGLNAPAMLAGELGRYLDPRFLGYIVVGPAFARLLRLKWAALAGLWLCALRRAARARDRRVLSLAAWISIHLAYYALLVSNKNPNYASVVEPFALALAAVELSAIFGEAHAPSSPAAAAALASACAALLYAGADLLAALWAAIAVPVLLETRRRREAALRLFFAALIPVFCVRVFTPWTWGALMADFPRELWGPAGVLGAVGAAFAAWSIAASGRKPSAAAGAAALGLSAALALSSAADAAAILRDARRAVVYDSIAARARALVSPGSRVIGPQLMWFAFQDRPYRDFDGLSYAKWLTGNGDVTAYAERWRPDYLIVDCRFPDIFLKHRTLAQTLRLRLTEVGRVDDGRDYCHPLIVYRITR